MYQPITPVPGGIHILEQIQAIGRNRVVGAQPAAFHSQILARVNRLKLVSESFVHFFPRGSLAHPPILDSDFLIAPFSVA